MTAAIATTATALLRIALYLRISLDRTGECAGVDRQRDSCATLARARGGAVVAEFVDNSISAKGKAVRPAFRALLAAVERGELDMIVAWDMTRLTRNARDRWDLAQACKQHGVSLLFVRGSEMNVREVHGRIALHVMGELAEEEIELKGARQADAAAQRADRGEAPQGRPPYGYLASGEIDPVAGPVVREMFARFAAGESIVGLTRWLDAEVPSPSQVPFRCASHVGPRWARSVVRDVLTNPRHAGQAVYQGQATGKRGTWQAIVTDEVFDRVQTILTTPGRKTNKVGTDRRWLGTSLYICDCGGRMRGHGTTKGIRRYGCEQCKRTRTAQPIDDLVLAVIRARLARPDLRDLLPSADAGEVKRLGDELDTLRRRLERTESDYDSDLIDGRRFKVKSDRIAVEMAEVRRRMATLTAVEATTGTVLLADDPVQAFDDASLMVQRQVLDVLCEVRLRPVERGRQGFDPETVKITPKIIERSE